jgi:hypothetical protein
MGLPRSRARVHFRSSRRTAQTRSARDGGLISAAAAVVPRLLVVLTVDASCQLTILALNELLQGLPSMRSPFAVRWQALKPSLFNAVWTCHISFRGAAAALFPVSLILLCLQRAGSVFAPKLRPCPALRAPLSHRGALSTRLARKLWLAIASLLAGL